MSESVDADRGSNLDVSVQACEKKEAGNAAFKDGRIEVALAAYGEALEFLRANNVKDESFAAAIASNQAMCHIKLGRFEEAEERSTNALVIKPGHSKARYRRGIARLRLGNAEGALEDLEIAMAMEPGSREIQLKLQETRSVMEQATVPDEREVAVATSATSAIGSTDGGLYADKHDVNEGRLAETYKEQKEWIESIQEWCEITDIAFADENGKVSVYMKLPGVHEIPPNKVCVWMRQKSLEVRVVDLNHKNWMYIAQELWGHIDVGASSYKIRPDKLTLKLQKRSSARSSDTWEKLRRI